MKTALFLVGIALVTPVSASEPTEHRTISLKECNALAEMLRYGGAEAKRARRAQKVIEDVFFGRDREIYQAQLGPEPEIPGRALGIVAEFMTETCGIKP